MILRRQLFALGHGAAMQTAAKLILTRVHGEGMGEEVAQIVRKDAQPLFNANAVADTRVAISAALGAGLTTTMLRVGITPLTFIGGLTLSEVNMEWKESLTSGLITAVGTWIGTVVSIKLLRRHLIQKLNKLV